MDNGRTILSVYYKIRDRDHPRIVLLYRTYAFKFMTCSSPEICTHIHILMCKWYIYMKNIVYVQKSDGNKHTINILNVKVLSHTCAIEPIR